MNDMQNALLKSGLINQERVNKVNKEQLDEDKKRKKDAVVLREVTHGCVGSLDNEKKQSKKKVQEVTKKKNIYDKMWDDEKKSKFLTHLLWNFVPTSKVSFVTDWEGDRFKKKACCICNVTLISKSDAFEKVPEIATRMVEGLKKLVEGKEIKVENDIKAVFKEKTYMGLYTDDSNVLFCPTCYQDFIDWIGCRLLTTNDAKLSRILRKLRINK